MFPYKKEGLDFGFFVFFLFGFFLFLYISMGSFHAVLPCWLHSIKLAQLQKLLKLAQGQYE